MEKKMMEKEIIGKTTILGIYNDGRIKFQGYVYTYNCFDLNGEKKNKKQLMIVERIKKSLIRSGLRVVIDTEVYDG